MMAFGLLNTIVSVLWQQLVSMELGAIFVLQDNIWPTVALPGNSADISEY